TAARRPGHGPGDRRPAPARVARRGPAAGHPAGDAARAGGQSPVLGADRGALRTRDRGTGGRGSADTGLPARPGGFAAAAGAPAPLNPVPAIPLTAVFRRHRTPRPAAFAGRGEFTPGR